MTSKRMQMMLLRDQGLTHREIAERFGVSRQYVAMVCGRFDPVYFSPIGKECIYPNLRKWMNIHKVSRKEFLRRMDLTPSSNNYDRLNSYLYGIGYPRKPYIDKMLAITGLTYEELFKTEDEDG